MGATGRATAWLALLVVVPPACAPSEADHELARMAVLDANADFREEAIGTFIRAADGQPLDEGDEVRTDETGFAEIEYIDGSLTRLDVETTFVVHELGGPVASPDIEVELDTGRMWNRVREVSATTGRFDVETSFGVASARGTAFWVACNDTGCNVSVTHGRIAFTLDDGTELFVDAGEGIRVGPDGEEERGPIDPDLLDPDAWVGSNLARDDDLARFGDDREQCNAVFAGQSLNRATSPDRAVVVDITPEPHEAAIVARDPISAYAIDLQLGPLAVPVADGTVDPPMPRLQTPFDVGDYAFVGVGLYEITGSTEGAACSFRAYLRVVGRHPVTTVLGAAGLVLLLLGGMGTFVAAVRARRARRDPGRHREGHRVLGAASGAVAGFGAAVVLQQFGVLPLSVSLLVGAPVIGLVVGTVAGFPRDGAGRPVASDREGEPGP